MERKVTEPGPDGAQPGPASGSEPGFGASGRARPRPKESGRLKTIVRTLEDNKVELTVELPEGQIARAIDEEWRELARTVKVPGFRQGKAPRDVLERRLGKDAVIHTVIEKHVLPTYPRAVDEAGLRPVDLPEIHVDDYRGGPLSYKATIEVQPEAHIEDYVGIEVTVPPVEVSEEEVEEQLDRLRQRFAKLEVIEGRPVRSGDFVLIDFTGYLDDIAFEGGAGSDFLLEIGSGRFLPGFEDGLIGAEKGETKEVWIDVPGDYHGTAIAGKRVRFDVTVKEIKEKSLPELTDEFAGEASEHDTIEDLRISIFAQIREAKERAVHIKTQSQILDWLERNVEVEVPQKMIDRKHEQLLEEFLQMLHGQGLTLEQYFQMSDSNREVLKASMEAEATKRVREELALDAIAEREGIIIEDPDLDMEIEEWAARFGRDPTEVRDRMVERGTLGDVRWSVRRRKTLDWLAERVAATVKEEEPSTDESSSTEPAPQEGTD